MTPRAGAVIALLQQAAVVTAAGDFEAARILIESAGRLLDVGAAVVQLEDARRRLGR